MRILVAVGFLMYRDVIAGALRKLRPQTVVVAVAPEDLAEQLARFDPHLVVCSAIPETAPRHPLTWVVLFTDGEATARVDLDGQTRDVDNLPFEELLRIVDRTETLLAPA
jgi:hypothetical protein